MKDSTTATVYSKNGRWHLTLDELEYKGPSLHVKHQQIPLVEDQEVTVRAVSDDVLQVSDGGRLCVIFYRGMR